MSEMTPLEAAEKLEVLIDYAGDTLDDALEFDLRQVVKVAASLCRKIAAGEYALVVHGYWDATDIFGEDPLKCSVCGNTTSVFGYEYCPHCGALMDGKNGKS